MRTHLLQVFSGLVLKRAVSDHTPRARKEQDGEDEEADTRRGAAPARRFGLGTCGSTPMAGRPGAAWMGRVRRSTSPRRQTPTITPTGCSTASWTITRRRTAFTPPGAARLLEACNDLDGA